MVYWYIYIYIQKKNQKEFKNYEKNIFHFYGATASSGPGPPHYQGLTITLRHTTLDTTPLDEWLVWRRDLCLTTHNNHNRQIWIARRVSNPQSQQESCSRSTPHTAWPPGWHETNSTNVKPSSLHRQNSRKLGILYHCIIHITDIGGRADWIVGLWSLDCWNWRSNPVKAWMFVSCVCFVLCRYWPLRRTDHSCRGVLPGVSV